MSETQVSQSRIHGTKRWMVEDVEELASESKIYVFTEKEAFRESHIPVDGSWAANDAVALIAEGSKWWRRKRIRVEPPIKRARSVWAANHIGPLQASARSLVIGWKRNG